MKADLGQSYPIYISQILVPITEDLEGRSYADSKGTSCPIQKE